MTASAPPARSCKQTNAIQLSTASKTFAILYPTQLICKHPEDGQPPLSIKVDNRNILRHLLPATVHFTKDQRIKHILAVITAQDFQKNEQTSDPNKLFQDAIQQAKNLHGATLTLVILGSNARNLQTCIVRLQVQLKLNTRLVNMVQSLHEVVASYAVAILCPEKDSFAEITNPVAQEILRGMTVKDVLHNSTPAHKCASAYLMALTQIVSRKRAQAVQEAYPTFRRLYDECQTQSGQQALANVRVPGINQRLGPSAAARICFVMREDRENALNHFPD